MKNEPKFIKEMTWITKRIKKLLESKGYEKRHSVFATDHGLPPTTLWRVEHLTTNPSLDSFVAVSRALDVPPEYLLCKDDKLADMILAFYHSKTP